MNICFFGSGVVAAQTLDYLKQEKIKVIKIISKKEKKSGRGMQIQSSAVKKFAEKNSIDFYQPEDWQDCSFLENCPCPFFVVVNYGKILPSKILSLPQSACLNIHFSLLPRWRGASPVRDCLKNGDAVSGISIIKMNEKLDAGDILAQKKIPITSDTNHENLTQELIFLGAQELVRVLKNYTSIQPIPQKEELVTYSKKWNKETAKIPWQSSAQKIYWLYQAMSPKPAIWTFWKGKKILFKKITLADTKKSNPSAGKIVAMTPSYLEVTAATGSLFLEEVQMENKKAIPVQDWCNGYRVSLGESFG